MLKILLLTCLIGRDPDECVPQTARSVVELGMARGLAMHMIGGQSVTAGARIPTPERRRQKFNCEEVDDRL